MESRKRKTPDLYGGGIGASPDKLKTPIVDMELEETEDLVSGDPDEGQGDGDLSVGETQSLNQMGIVGGDSDELRGRSAYFVACHWDWSSAPKPFSVYKLDVAPSDASPARRKLPRLRRAARLEMAAGGKTFAALRSSRRAWIVGVGGNSGDTVFFDTRTRKVISGPILKSAKWNPVLTAVGDRVYAMCRSPSWIRDPDFPPWFKVLDLSKARVAATVADRYHLEGCSWSALPNPPCLPWKLSPFEYQYKLPTVIVMSYVVVAPYILVSFNETYGTHAFDTDSLKWHKVDDERLPFFGCAVSQGSSVFIALSKRNGPVNAYRICVANSGKDHALKLSITALPVRYMGHEVDAGPCLSSLDNGRFCSLSLLVHHEDLELSPRKAHVYFRTYQIENLSLLEAPQKVLLAGKPEITISSKREQAFKIISSSQGFSASSFTLLSV